MGLFSLFSSIKKLPIKKINTQIETLQKSYNRLISIAGIKFEFLFGELEHLSKALFSLSPKKILDRGYAIPSKENGMVIRNSSDLKKGESFHLKLANSSLVAKKTSDIKHE